MKTDTQRFPKSLTKLANLYGSDKGTLGPSDSWNAHNYTDIYEGYLSHLRSRPINLLEIGLGVQGDRLDVRIAHGRNSSGGASLKMWHDYFPNAQIFGLDLNDAKFLDNDRIRTFVADQGNRQDMQQFIDAIGGTKFDIIVDDGSHRPDHQQFSLGFLFEHMADDGLYIIEDLLSNGLRDNARGSMVSANILNTRTVLKSMQQHGEFAAPHAIDNPEYLSRNIAAINFHAPTLSIKIRPNWRIPRLFKKVANFTTDREKLCVIRKISHSANHDTPSPSES